MNGLLSGPIQSDHPIFEFKPMKHCRRILPATVAGGMIVPLLLLAVTYPNWGYERHLAVEAYPIGNAPINPTFQFAVEYRKRFDLLPGERTRLEPATISEIGAIRGSALRRFDWNSDVLRGTTYSFQPDFSPLPGWSERPKAAAGFPSTKLDG